MIQNPDERLFKMIGELVGEYEDKGVFVNPPRPFQLLEYQILGKEGW